jgi:hypothetical protein
VFESLKDQLLKFTKFVQKNINTISKENKEYFEKLNSYIENQNNLIKKIEEKVEKSELGSQQIISENNKKIAKEMSTTLKTTKDDCRKKDKGVPFNILLRKKRKNIISKIFNSDNESKVFKLPHDFKSKSSISTNKFEKKKKKKSNPFTQVSSHGTTYKKIKKKVKSKKTPHISKITIKKKKKK